MIVGIIIALGTALSHSVLLTTLSGKYYYPPHFTDLKNWFRGMTQNDSVWQSSDPNQGLCSLYTLLLHEENGLVFPKSHPQNLPLPLYAYTLAYTNYPKHTLPEPSVLLSQNTHHTYKLLF